MMDGGDLDRMIWVNGSFIKPRFSSIRVIIDNDSFLGPADFFFWDITWCRMSCSPNHQRGCRCLARTVSTSSSIVDLSLLASKVLLIWGENWKVLIWSY